jgi:quercetin dioxygenase-like cupin family protein
MRPSNLLPFAAATSASLLTNTSRLIVDIAPSSPAPYILPNLYGDALQLGDDVFRLLCTKNSTGGAFTLLGTNGQLNSAVPAHHHANVYENFFLVKGRLRLWVNSEARDFYPGDFGAVPHLQNHSYQIMEPDTQITGFIQPGGFEDFFVNVSTPYVSVTGAPFPPDQALAFPFQQFVEVASLFDVTLETTAVLASDMVNGTTNGGIWHDGTNTLPGNSTTPYFIASGFGPMYLHRSTGQVIQPRATLAETDGNFTISTIAMRQRVANDTIACYKFTEPQTFQVLEGKLTLQMAGETNELIGGDVVFVPGNVTFSYWSTVRWTKFFVGAIGTGLDTTLLGDAESWDYAVFPNYF